MLRMGKWRTLGTVISISKHQAAHAKLGSDKVAGKTSSKWRKLLIPVKASKILSQANKRNIVDKSKTTKPNPPFKRDAWKHEKPKVSNGNQKQKSILKKESVGQASKAKKVKINEKPAPTRARKKGTVEKKPLTSSLKKRSSKSSQIIKRNEDDQNKDQPPMRRNEEHIMRSSQHWHKIRLMLNYMKIKNPSIISLGKPSSAREDSSFNNISANLQAMKMGDKFKELKHRNKTSIPRCGGRRNHGEYDYQGVIIVYLEEKDFYEHLDRYKQHPLEKRFDPMTPAYIHTTNVEWNHYKGSNSRVA